ncbi:MAG TPA: AAA family ATPase [Labilithrix sp.]|jgi:MoxR-like ATPase
MTQAVPVFATADLRAASGRFRTFFDELSRAFVERDDVLTQIALALLGREHVLMTGPPGTAKSGIAAAVLGRIIDERTGEPSVFARQFTESTVQTDLVGPIDFKTLMQTGRTEHFTDEGMLGAVHAFLDEVLDGRDMLLRTTLNVLHERELKQGTKTTRGRIEAALMTTNRYLAEVLESSRETLLAFVDRVAFVSFVPKGFAQPASLEKVLRTQVGGMRAPSLKAVLTIQDLDVLQAAAERVVVPPEITQALCALVEQMDVELASATKNDPSFLPTRYLSTRTAVRLGRILKSICVYDVVMKGADRDFVVEAPDLALLRLSLLLSGPDRDGVARLLEKESDPRERRQLGILRTERDIFERVLARVPKPVRRASKAPPAPSSVQQLERQVHAAIPGADAKPLLETATKLAQAVDGGGANAGQAADLLATTLAHLSERAVRLGTTAGAGPQGAFEVVGELASLADGLEKASGSTRPVARWLRGRAIQVLLDGAVLASTMIGKSLDATMPAEASLEDVSEQAVQALAGLEKILELCAKLRAAGAEEDAPNAFDKAIAVAVARVEDELVEIWDTGFRDTVTAALAKVGGEQLGPLVKALAPALARIDAFGDRLAKLGGNAASLKSRVVGPRIEPLVRAAFERIEGKDRLELVEQVGELVEHLDRGGLKTVVPASTLLRHAIVALVRSEHAREKRPEYTKDFVGYRALRADEQRVSLAYTVVELALRVAPEPPKATAAPGEIAKALGGIVAQLPAELRTKVVDLDLGRIERAVKLVEEWWKTNAEGAGAAASSADIRQIGFSYGKLVDSKFFHVTRDEGALLRFALESRVVGEVFPESAPRVQTIRARIDTLEAESSAVLVALRRGRADTAWTSLLGPASTRKP